MLMLVSRRTKLFPSQLGDNENLQAMCRFHPPSPPTPYHPPTHPSTHPIPPSAASCLLFYGFSLRLRTIVGAAACLGLFVIRGRKANRLGKVAAGTTAMTLLVRCGRYCAMQTSNESSCRKWFVSLNKEVERKCRARPWQGNEKIMHD
jgi:hypothetical protein